LGIDFCKLFYTFSNQQKPLFFIVPSVAEDNILPPPSFPYSLIPLYNIENKGIREEESGGNTRLLRAIENKGLGISE